MDIVERFVRQKLDLHSEECESIFIRLIDRYEAEKKDCDARLECICEVFDYFRLSLTFMDFPGMANYGQVLSDEDELFMSEPKFLNEAQEREILITLESYFSSNHIDEDESDVYQEATLKIVPEWLAKCWTNANKLQGTQYNLFYFVHRYFNEPAINLINDEKLFLEDLKN